MPDNGPRYAIYYTSPRDSELTRFGEAWLCRDAWTGEDLVDRYGSAGWTASPRKYGWHATLKAPFFLHPRRSKEELLEAVSDFARARSAFVAPPLQFKRLRRFLALTLAETSQDMNCLAAECVRCFDRFRAPMSGAEFARKAVPGLSDGQLQLLTDWGYPYVFEHFQFHMSLTGSLAERELDAAERVVRPLTKPFEETGSHPIQAVTLFEQIRPDAPFVIKAEFRLGAGY